MLNWEFDTPSFHDNNRLPVLDLNIWLDDKDDFTPIKHTFYQKEMTNKKVVLASSATPLNMKKAILTEEGLRRLKSCSPSLPWSHKVEVMTEYNWWLMVSGHSETFRIEITNRILKKSEQLLENHKQDISPF